MALVHIVVQPEDSSSCAFTRQATRLHTDVLSETVQISEFQTLKAQIVSDVRLQKDSFIICQGKTF